AHLDARLLDTLPGAVEGALDDVDSRHLPAPFGQAHTPDTAAGADVEGRAEGRSAGLLAGDQVDQPVRERRMLGEILPGMEPERVGESIVHGGPRLCAALPFRIG